MERGRECQGREGRCLRMCRFVPCETLSSGLGWQVVWTRTGALMSMSLLLILIKRPTAVYSSGLEQCHIRRMHAGVPGASDVVHLPSRSCSSVSHFLLSSSLPLYRYSPSTIHTSRNQFCRRPDICLNLAAWSSRIKRRHARNMAPFRSPAVLHLALSDANDDSHDDTTDTSHAWKA